MLRFFRLMLFVVALSLPVFWFYQAWQNALGPDPGKVLVERLGVGGVVLLLLTLSMSPLKQLTGSGLALALRRQLGLWCFAYALLHGVAYLIFINGLSVSQLLADLTERPYIIVGLAAWLILLALAVTSNKRSMRALKRRWKTLHRLIYPALVLVMLHMLWIVRADLSEWALYAAVGAVLLVWRLPWRRAKSAVNV